MVNWKKHTNSFGDSIFETIHQGYEITVLHVDPLDHMTIYIKMNGEIVKSFKKEYFAETDNLESVLAELLHRIDWEQL